MQLFCYTTDFNCTAYSSMYALGIDFGTTGVRASLIDIQQLEHWSAHIDWPQAAQEAQHWRAALMDLMQQVPETYRQQIDYVAVDGTSGTVLLTGADLQPVTPIMGYNHALSHDPAQKLSWLKQHDARHHARYLMHQTDYCNSLLLGKPGASDYHSALKSGFNPHTLQWNADLYTAKDRDLLPEVVAPGSLLGPLRSDWARQWGYSAGCEIHAGTTDSIAAFIAAAPDYLPGTAVTSLGSTLVIKLLSSTPVFSAEHGVYSHRFGNLWLTGGASNTGGAVLRHYFNDTELEQLSAQIQPEQPSQFDYYPLLHAGERFPVNDPQLAPRLTPRPADSVSWLHGLLEGMAAIEQQGYARLIALGATPPSRILSSGGGSRNLAWQAIRQRRLGIPVARARHGEAAYGSALLAMGLNIGAKYGQIL